MISVEKPGTPSELVHHGVKGQKWGVRKAEETISRNIPIGKQHKNLSNHVENIVDNHESSEHHLTSEQKKKLAYTVTGAIVAAGIIGGGYYLYKRSGASVSPPKELSNYQKYLHGVGGSFKRSVGSIPQSALSRPDYTLPSGHSFFRLSSGAETKFLHHTYAASSIDDFNRYVTSIGGGHLNTKITFKSTKPVKVASTKTVVDTLREIFPKHFSGGKNISNEQAIGLYENRIGGKFDDDVSKQLFKTLKNKGYHAIFYENDAGIFSESPVVIFNHSGLSSKVSESMSKETIGQIHKIVKPVVDNLK